MTDTNTKKAVILARGLGTRMRKVDQNAQLTDAQSSVAQTGVKAMIPIDRPFLDYVLHDLADAGYHDICLVIGPEHDQLRQYYGQTLTYQRLNVTFAIQAEPLGTADAVAAAEDFAGDDHILVINSDNQYPVEALGALRQLHEPGLASFDRDAMVAQSNIPSERVTRFAVVQSDPQGYMLSIIEKPDPQTIAQLPTPICVSMNCWRFSPNIFPACRAIEPSPRGELELPDAVLYTMANLNERYRALPFQAPVLDLSSREDIATITAKLTGKKLHL